MKRVLLLAALLCVAANEAHARKDCEQLRQEIAGKIEANGVRDYQLQVVAADELGDARQVGSCDGGSKRIAYRRGTLPLAAIVANVPAANPQP